MPHLTPPLNLLDLLLIIVISVQAAGLVYLRQSGWKAFMLSLPFPFAIMTLALVHPIDATYILGLFLLLLLTHGVRVFYRTFHLPTVPAIALSALGYSLLSWLTVPIIAVIVVLLVMVKNTLQDFATIFPKVGVIAVYESRFCLWTNGRQIPVIVLSIGTLIAVTYLSQLQLGLPLPLLAGWSVFLFVFGALTIQIWSRERSSPVSRRVS